MSSHLRSQLAGAALAISFIAFYFVSGARAQGVTALNGVYNGTYRCAQGATTLKLSITSTAGGELSSLFTFYLPPGTQNQSYTYRLIGQYDPRTAKFSLMPVAWETAHPSNFAMVGLNGTFDSNELTGTITGAGCSTFQVERERGQPGRAAAATPPPTAAAPRPQPAPAQAPARPSAPPAQTRQANIDQTIKDTAATTATAQAPRKAACDLLSAADVEAVLGVSPLRPIDPASRFRPGVLRAGESCQFENVAKVSVINISVSYTDVPDADAIVKYLKALETQTFDKARAIADIGDAAFYQEPVGKTLVVFVGGNMVIRLGAGTPEQLTALAKKALGGAGRTTFAYNGVVPAVPRPVSPPPTNAASTSPLDALKSALTKKAEAGDIPAEEALAGLYRFAKGSGSNAAKPDFAAARYWYKRASDHGVARASYQLGTMYHEGIGGPVNDDAAQALFTKAADTGYVPAMLPLAFIYAAKPDFVSKRRAAEWALKAAAADDPEGHLVAGYLWDKDLLSFDQAESGRNALAEYRKAADRGNCIAMMNTGGLYFNGSHGLKQDATQAQAWFDRAQACFGKDFQEMQEKAARYRSLAAAGHLPVPQAPPPLPKGSRFFSQKPGAQRDDLLVSIVGDMLEMTVLGVAYLVAHPEELAKLPAPTQYPGVPSGLNDVQHGMEFNSIIGKSFNCSMVVGGCQ